MEKIDTDNNFHKNNETLETPAGGGGGGNSQKKWVGKLSAARFPKPLPYL